VEMEDLTLGKTVMTETEMMVKDAIQIVLAQYQAGLVHLLPQHLHLLAGQLVEMA